MKQKSIQTCLFSILCILTHGSPIVDNAVRNSRLSQDDTRDASMMAQCLVNHGDHSVQAEATYNSFWPNRDQSSLKNGNRDLSTNDDVTRSILDPFVPESENFTSPFPKELSSAVEEMEPERLSHNIFVPVRNRAHKGLSLQPLIYHLGQPILTDEVKVYFIWYGNWKGQSKSIDILENLIRNLNETQWYQMMKSYYFQKDENSEKVFVNGKLSFEKSVFDEGYSLGKVFREGSISKIVNAKIESKELPYEYSAVYFVLASDDISEEMDSGNKFGKDYCGYHDASTLHSGEKFFFSFIGHPGKHLQICGASVGESPNNDRAIDSMASSIAHELVETVSDPDATDNRAWEDQNGNENGDKCAYRYGKVSRTVSHQKYNLVAGHYNYLIQQNWDIQKQACSSGVL